MDKTPFSFRTIAYHENDKTFTEVCLDLDIVEEGHATLQEAIVNISNAIMSHLQASKKLGNPKELLERPAPKEYWDKLDEMVHAKPKAAHFAPFQFFTAPQLL